MSNTKIFYFRGVGKWCKFTTPDKKYNHYTCDLYPDAESLELFETSGLGLKLRSDDEGNFIKLRRTPTKIVAGDVVDIGPPKVFVVGEDGKPEVFEGLVGNGSKIVCKITVYDTVKGPGHRLESVLVEELVEYAKAEVMNDEEFPF